MKNQYQISFKGKDTPIVLDEERGKPIYEQWLNDKLPSKLEVRRGFAVLSSTIKAIELLEERPETDHHADSKYEDFIRQFRAMSAKEKSKHLARFTLMYRVRAQRLEGKKFKDTSVPQAILEKARSIQEKFYSKHPHAFELPNSEYGELLEGKTDSILA